MTCRHSHVHLGVVVGLLLVTAFGCSRGGQKGDEPIGVQTSSFGVNLENRSGARISDITVEIVPYGAATSYTVKHYGLSSSEKRDFYLYNFRARDGMALDLSVSRPKLVRVTATDFNGKPMTVEVPWR